jgi:surface antigen
MLNTDSTMGSPEVSRSLPADEAAQLKQVAKLLGDMDVLTLQVRIRENMNDLVEEIWSNADWRARVTSTYGSRKAFESSLRRLQSSLRGGTETAAPSTEELRERKGLAIRALEGGNSFVRGVWRHKGKIIAGIVAAIVMQRFGKAMWDYFQGYLHKAAARVPQKEIEGAMGKDAAIVKKLPEVGPTDSKTTPSDSKMLGGDGSFKPGAKPAKPVSPPYTGE